MPTLWWGIYFIGPALSVLVFLAVMFLAFKNQHHKLPEGFLMAISVYFLLAPVVHPWYLTSLVALSALTTWRYPIVWSGMGILSYAAYKTTSYQENLYLVALEYAVVFGVLAYEIISIRKSGQISAHA